MKSTRNKYEKLNDDEVKKKKPVRPHSLPKPHNKTKVKKSDETNLYGPCGCKSALIWRQQTEQTEQTKQTIVPPPVTISRKQKNNTTLYEDEKPSSKFIFQRV